MQHVTDLGRRKAASLSGSCELVQSCLSSTCKMSEQKVSVSVEQRIIIKFLTAEGVKLTEILQFGVACLECSFSKLSVTSPTSQLILQPFRRFTYVTD